MRALADGRLQLDDLDSLDDEAVIARLMEVKGFGRWTAEMFLMFRLHRPDVLPVGDLGIVNAVQRLYGLRKRPDAKKLYKLGEPWRPYRSVASWYLWQSLTKISNERSVGLRSGDRSIQTRPACLRGLDQTLSAQSKARRHFRRL